MRIVIGAFFCILMLTGCTSTVKIQNPNALTTEEIISVLKYESIDLVGTTHSNHVSITLKNGAHYSGIYNPLDIPEYRRNKSLHPASNMVEHIKKWRGETWAHFAE